MKRSSPSRSSTSVDARLREQRRARPLGLDGAQAVAARRGREQVAQLALVDDRALADDRDAVAELLDLVQEVAREQDRDPVAGEPADEVAHVAHAGRVEAGRRLVEQQQPRLAQQRRRDPEPLAHPVRVAADAVLRAVAQLDDLEHLVDARARDGLVVVGEQLAGSAGPERYG